MDALLGNARGIIYDSSQLQDGTYQAMNYSDSSSFPRKARALKSGGMKSWEGWGSVYKTSNSDKELFDFVIRIVNNRNAINHQSAITIEPSVEKRFMKDFSSFSVDSGLEMDVDGGVNEIDGPAKPLQFSFGKEILGNILRYAEIESAVAEGMYDYDFAPMEFTKEDSKFVDIPEENTLLPIYTAAGFDSDSGTDFADGAFSNYIDTGKKIFKKSMQILRKNKKGTIYGYVGNRGFGAPQPLKNIASVPAQFVYGGLLKLDGYPFVVEGTKEDIISFFEPGKYLANQFGTKAGCKIFMNIRGCLDSVELMELVRGSITQILMPAINEISMVIFEQLVNCSPQFVNFFGKLMEEIAEGIKPVFADLKKIISDFVDFDIGAVIKNVEMGREAMENQGEAGESAKAYMIKFAKALVDKVGEVDVSKILSGHEVNHVSGPRFLFKDIHGSKRVQIEFDCKESCASQACLQLSIEKNEMASERESEMSKSTYPFVTNLVSFENVHDILKKL